LQLDEVGLGGLSCVSLINFGNRRPLCPTAIYRGWDGFPPRKQQNCAANNSWICFGDDGIQYFNSRIASNGLNLCFRDMPKTWFQFTWTTLLKNRPGFLVGESPTRLEGPRLMAVDGTRMWM